MLDIKQNKVGSTVISSYDYGVNSIGQRTTVATSGTAFPAIPSWAWSYDSLGQVTAADSSVATSDRSYQYDSIGNRQKSANSLILPVAANYTANALNQYSTITNPQSSLINPSYDFDGNATSYPLPATPTANGTLAWDGENRLISSTSGAVTTTYQYDAQSRRIAKIAGSAATAAAATLYLYDGWNCLAEYSKTAGATPVTALAKTYLWGSDLGSVGVSPTSLQSAGGVGGLLAVKSGSTSHFPTYDGNGNVSEYLTATGTVAAHFEYDAFGNTVINSDSSNLFPYKFSTKPRDTETGLYYYGYRYYDANTGRWINRDSIEEEGGVNLYGMVDNGAIGKWDILGNATSRCINKKIGTKEFTAGTRSTSAMSGSSKQTFKSNKQMIFAWTCEICTCLVSGGLGWEKIDSDTEKSNNNGMGWPDGYESDMRKESDAAEEKLKSKCTAR